MDKIGKLIGSQCPLGHKEIEHIAEYTVAPKLQKREMTRQYINGKGERRFTGGGDLKASQAYPLPFLCFNVRLFGV